MENLKMQLVVVAFWALVQTYEEVSCGAEERRLSRDWQEDASVERAVFYPIGCLHKRSKALRFYGLMGKRSVSKRPSIARRKKGEIFVELMERSISNSESLTKIHPSVTTTAERCESGRAKK
uniref:Uncharacterized protein n=1 Tax=Gouania willdenowi TaxID=441366 RepID=A0A8C5GB20_GOUWI